MQLPTAGILGVRLRIAPSGSVRDAQAASSFPFHSLPLAVSFALSYSPFQLLYKKQDARIVMVTLRSHAAKQQDPWDNDPAALQGNLPLVSSQLWLMYCEYQLIKTQEEVKCVTGEEEGRHGLPLSCPNL